MYLLITILLITFLLIIEDKSENFSTKPTEEEKNKYADIILNNANYFSKDINIVKKKYPWIDIITLEEIRQLIFNQSLNRETILSTFK